MAVAGICWGGYSLRGRGSPDPLGETTFNFLRSIPMVLLVGVVSLGNLEVSWRGALLACLSGSLASGVGYAIWYAALRGLSRTRAATVQLVVPLLAALGGVVFLSETVSLRLLLSAIVILGGVGLAVAVRGRD